jgi:hypothetical protein
VADRGHGADEAGRTEGADEAALAVAARHALHDEELVAAFATGSLEDDGERARVQQLVDRCAACRDLHRDVEAIGSALRGTAQFSTTAPRDFRLTEADALRLGGTVRGRGFIARLRRTLAGVARPLGASMAAIGIVGVLVGSATLGGFAAAPLSIDANGLKDTGAPEVNPGGPQAPVPEATDRTAHIQPGATFGEGGVGAGEGPREGDGADHTTTAASASAWLLGGSIGLLAVGLALLLATFWRRRVSRPRA